MEDSIKLEHDIKYHFTKLSLIRIERESVDARQNCVDKQESCQFLIPSLLSITLGD